MTGRIKFFSKSKGWGFIVGDDGKDYFFHNANVKNRYKWTPQADEKVTFDFEDAPKGTMAVNVTKAKD